MHANAGHRISGRSSQPDGPRRDLLREGWADVGKVFIAATVLDLIYELFVYRWVYPGQALIMAAVLAFIPYLLIRGPVTRIARRFVVPDRN